MLPKHCREVSLKRVSFSLTEDEMIKRAAGKKAYTITNYIILHNNGAWAVTRIEKAEGSTLFREIKKVEIISLPKNTGYIEDPTIDVLNPTAMAKIAEKMGKETLVVKGKFGHVSFVHKEKPICLTVFDVVPSDPPKLVELVESALSIGRIQKPIKLVRDIVDLNALAQASNTSFTMFPCHVSGFKTKKKYLYLDEAPDISSIGVDNITLIGCDLSLRTFTSLYGEEPAFINMCPKMRMMKEQIATMGIARCCTLNEEYELVGHTAYVSWGARASQVEEAILDLLGY